MADECGIHPQALYMVESGTYSTIPPSIVSYLSKQDYDSQELQGKYLEFVNATRATTRELYDWENIRPAGYSTAQPPFQTYRDVLGLSRQAVAKLLCVQSALLYKLETGKCKKLPGQLIEALRAVGVPWTVINTLNAWTEKYYWSV